MAVQSNRSPRSTPQRSLTGRLLAGSASYLLARLVMLACGLAIFLFLSRALGPAAYGTYALAVAIGQWFSLVMGAIAGGATISLVAGHPAGDRFASTILRVTLGVGLFLASVVGLGASWLAQLLHAPELTLPLLMVALDIPLAGLATVHSQILTARSQFQLSAALTAGYWISRISLSWMLVQAGMGVVGATVALPLASLVYTLAGRSLSRVPIWSCQAMPVRELWTYNRMRTVSSLLNSLLKNVDMLAVQWWSNSANTTGLYAAAKNVALLLTLIFSSSQSAMLSTLAKSYGQAETSLTDSLGRQYLRASIYIGGLIIALGALSLNGMGIMLGPSYREAGPIAMILITGAGFQLLNASALILIHARGERGSMTLALAIITPLALGLYYYLPGQLPSLPAPMTHAFLSTTIVAVITALALRKMVQICHTPLPWRTLICTGLAISLTIAVAIELDRGWLPGSSRLNLLGQAFLCSIVYLLALLGLGEKLIPQWLPRRHE